MRYLLLIAFLLALPAQAQTIVGNSPFYFAEVGGGKLPGSLAAVWEFESANPLDDSHGVNDLTNNTAVTFTAGKVGDAATFDGNHDLQIADNASIGLGTDESFSIIMWVNWTTGNKIAIMKGAGGNNNKEWEAQMRSGPTLRYKLGYAGETNSITWNTTGPINDQWVCLEFSHDAATDVLRVSLDGGTPTTTAHTGGTNDTAYNLYIGSEAGSNKFIGQIDQVFYYVGHFVSETYIDCVCNSGSGRTYIDLDTCGDDGDSG